MSKGSKIRNICILGHIDHGKTTLADSLVASNGIISNRMAGQLRYMDDLPQEQNRGITMKSSAIALLRTQKVDGEERNFVINLIDSPGHVDFSSEVSTAVRLSDGAVVIVDVVEGVCPQTRAVLRQAWQERLKPVLVINKIDRLITELKMTPRESLNHLSQLVIEINAVIGELFAASVMEEAHKEKDSGDLSSGLSEVDDANLYFNPASGNVIFASAKDGWGFRPVDFARVYAEKWSCNAEVLGKTLWGDYFIQGKGKVSRGALAKGKKNLFEQLVLEPIWALYEASLLSRNEGKLQRIVNSLNIKILQREMNHRDGKVVLRAIAVKWLPLSECVLDCVIEQVPSPDALSEERVEKLLSGVNGDFSSLPLEAQALKKSFLECQEDVDSDGKPVPVVVYVAKMFRANSRDLDKNSETKTSEVEVSKEEAKLRRESAIQSNKARMERYHKKKENDPPDTNGVTESGGDASDYNDDSSESVDGEDAMNFGHIELVAFARVFSGRARPGQKLFLLHPKFDPSKVDCDGALDPDGLAIGPVPGVKHASVVRLGQVLQLMGRDFRQPPNGMPAGHVLGIRGVTSVLKSATLTSTLMCPAFTSHFDNTDPIMCVAIEPERPKDLNRLEIALSLLEKADPCLRVSFEDSGENLISAAGEVHLQKILEDLRETFAPDVDFSVSPFRVPFRETLRRDTNALPPLVETVVGLPQCPRALRLKVRAMPLSKNVAECIKKFGALLRRRSKLSFLEENEKKKEFKRELNLALIKMRNKLRSGGRVNLNEMLTSENLLACGPERDGQNMLFGVAPYLKEKEQSNFTGLHLEQLLILGFRAAMRAGPLCEEPVQGVAFVVEDVCEVNQQADEAGKLHPGPIEKANSGQVMATAEKAIRRAMEEAGPRVMLAMYTMDLMVRTSVLGRLYAVIGRRHGRVVKEELREGEDMFDVSAHLPVVDSFGLADDIRKSTSGHALQPQLRFTHWEVQEFDPNGEPGEDDDEQREDWFRTIRLINDVRRRKGLFVREQLVECGEKQRNLSKKK